MQEPNCHGVYQAETMIEVARHGRSYAVVRLCQCEDGQYRYGLDFWGQVWGFHDPIRREGNGYPTATTAGDAGRQAMLSCWPEAKPHERRELQAMREQLEAGVRQLPLF